MSNVNKYTYDLTYLLKPNERSNKVWIVRDIEIWIEYEDETITAEDIKEQEREIENHLIALTSMEKTLDLLSKGYWRNIGTVELEYEMIQFEARNKVREHLKWFRSELERGLQLLATMSEKILFTKVPTIGGYDPELDVG